MNENLAAGIGVTGIIIYLAILVLIVVSGWKVFEKAGKPGWAFIVPIYNMVVLCEIVGKPVWWVIMMFIPCVNIVFAVWITNLLSKSFGKSEGFTVGLLLLSFIFYPILGFGDAQYQGPSAKEAQGFTNFKPEDYQRPYNNNDTGSAL